jgi:glycerate dehydrogenase
MAAGKFIESCLLPFWLYRKGSSMKIVFLDAKTIGDDIDLSAFDALGEVVKYDFSTTEQARERTRDADVIVLNKTEINERSIGEAERLKLVCVTATGTNNLDKEYLAQKEIAWRNVAGYSTESVAQHTFALLFYLMEQLRYYDDYVKSGAYVGDLSFTHFDHVFHELNGMTWGIIGLGNIGRRVADIAKMFGCNVLYYSTSGKNNQAGYQRVNLEKLLEASDIVSVHAPLTPETEGLMDAKVFSRMKKSAIFLNLGRGPIVVEQDLCDALENGEIAAAGLDVLSREPMSPDNPLGRIRDSGKLLITPHIGWASVEARTRLMDIIAGYIKEFFENKI